LGAAVLVGQAPVVGGVVGAVALVLAAALWLLLVRRQRRMPQDPGEA
jgi:hypothetical protein